MLSGIPCVHAQAAINYIHKDPVNFISSWYHKNNYNAIYTENILPVNGSNMWPRTDFIKPLPPLVRRMPGRPKVKRRRHASESQDSKYPTQRVKMPRTVRCGKCQDLGHNRNSCKNAATPKAPEPKRKNGRPRKDGSGQPNFDQFPPRPAVRPRREGEGTSNVAEGTSNVAEGSANVDDEARRGLKGKSVQMETGVSPGVSPMKRTKMMAKRGGKAKNVQRTPMKKIKQVPTQESLIGDDFFDELLRQTPYIPYKVNEHMEEVPSFNEHNVHEHMEQVAILNELNEVEADVDQNDADVNEVDIDQMVTDLLASGYPQEQIDEAIEKFKKDGEVMREETVINGEVEDREEVLVQGGRRLWQFPLVRTRRPSERIQKIKLSKIGPDPDGGGSSKEQAWSLD